ncbi:MAG: TOMM precursor leader peptide-binding protein, partial [Xenococcus sp. (in: cyanobacteria)]
MLDRPCFKPCYTVTTIEPDQVFILSERENTCLSDRFSYLVASLIDGQRSSDEIIEAIQIQLLPTQSTQDKSILFQQILDISIKAQAALFQMAKAGYIVEQNNILPANLISFCHDLKVNPSQAAHRLKTTKIAVKALANLEPEDLLASLRALNIQVIKELESEKPDLTVVLTDDYLNPDLDQFNQKSLQSQIPWLLVKPVGTMIWLGPLFNGSQTACWQCLASRLQENRPLESFIQRKNQRSVTAPQGLISATWQTALGMAATEIFKWIVQGKATRLTNNLITYDTLTLQSQEHFVVKRPQCSACGHNLVQQPLPVVLGHRQKTFTADGGHRCCPPQETLKKYQHHLSPLTGVVRELTKLPGNRLNHTYIAKHHFVTIFDDLDNLRKNLGGRSSGKGRTDTQARASGFCEAIERYSGVFQGHEARTNTSYQQMGERAIHPNNCLNFSQQQYQNRAEWNAECQGWFQKVPKLFDEERAIDWTAVWSLTDQDFKYLP